MLNHDTPETDNLSNQPARRSRADARVLGLKAGHPFIRALGRAHPVAWLMLVTILLFYIQPFKYTPYLLARISGLTFFLPLAGLWMASLFLLFGVHAIRRLMARRQGRANLPRPIPCQHEYLEDALWSYFGIALVISCLFFVKISIHAINPRLFDSVLETYDRAMFFGHDPVYFLVRLFQPHHVLLAIIDTVYNTVYYFVSLCSIPALALLSPERRNRLTFATAYILLWITGGVLYVAFPSWGPAFVHHASFGKVLSDMPTVNYVQGVLAKELYGLLTNPYGSRPVVFGGVAAFPSFHLAIMTVYTLASYRISRLWSLCNGIVAAIMFVGSMVTGYHYFSDSLTGVILGAGCFMLAGHWVEHYLKSKEIRA